MEHQIFEMQVKFYAERNLRIWSTKCEKRFVFKTVHDYLNTTFIFLVLRALQTDDLNVNRLDSSCLFDIMQFREHYARDKRNANFDHYFLAQI